MSSTGTTLKLRQWRLIADQQGGDLPIHFWMALRCLAVGLVVGFALVPSFIAVIIVAVIIVAVVIVAVVIVVGINVVGIIMVGIIMVNIFTSRVPIVLHHRLVLTMQCPDALQGRQDQAINHGSGRLKHADNPIRPRLMAMAAIGKAMGARESGAHPEPGRLRRRRSRNGLHRIAPETACGQVRPIEAGVGLLRADDAEAPVTITQGKWDRDRHSGITCPSLRFLLLNVPGRDVGVVDGGEHKLHGAPLRAEYEINASGIPCQRLGQLGSRQKQKHDARRAQAHQHNVHRRGER